MAGAFHHGPARWRGEQRKAVRSPTHRMPVDEEAPVRVERMCVSRGAALGQRMTCGATLVVSDELHLWRLTGAWVRLIWRQSVAEAEVGRVRPGLEFRGPTWRRDRCLDISTRALPCPASPLSLPRNGVAGRNRLAPTSWRRAASGCCRSSQGPAQPVTAWSLLCMTRSTAIRRTRVDDLGAAVRGRRSKGPS